MLAWKFTVLACGNSSLAGQCEVCAGQVWKPQQSDVLICKCDNEREVLQADWCDVRRELQSDKGLRVDSVKKDVRQLVQDGW